MSCSAAWGRLIASLAPSHEAAAPRRDASEEARDLFLAANPRDTGRLTLDREARAIHVELKRSGYRDRFDFVTRWASEPLDLLRELRELKPTRALQRTRAQPTGTTAQEQGRDVVTGSAASRTRPRPVRHRSTATPARSTGYPRPLLRSTRARNTARATAQPLEHAGEIASTGHGSACRKLKLLPFAGWPEKRVEHGDPAVAVELTGVLSGRGG
jgi:hypothetical protein